MKPTLLLLYKYKGSLCVFMVFLIDNLRPFFNIYVKHIESIDKSDIHKYDCIIPTDTPSNEFYNSIATSPFKSEFEDTYQILDNKAICAEFVKNLKWVDKIPTLTDINKKSVKNFMLKYPSDKFILKSTDGEGSFFQKIISSKSMFEMDVSGYKEYILQPYIDNYYVYSLDILAKDGKIISELYTKISKKNGVSFIDFFTSIRCEILKSQGPIYKKIQMFSNDLVNEIKFSGMMEIEFIVTKDKVYFLEVNPRMCGHVSQLDKNYNSIYFNNIIVPYVRYYGYKLPKHKITSLCISGTNPTITIMYFLKNYKYTISILFLFTVMLIQYLFPNILTYINAKLWS